MPNRLEKHGAVGRLRPYPLRIGGLSTPLWAEVEPQGKFAPDAGLGAEIDPE